MTIAFTVGGSRVVIPGVYSVFTVEDNLLNVTAAARNVLIVGESDEGVPGDQVNLQSAFFSDYPSLQSVYTSGPIVEAARQLFTVQPTAVFTGSVGRVYVYQTNAAERAEKELASPSNYGSLVATKFGESGNLIKAQVLQTAQVLPTETFSFVPSANTIAVQVGINGKPQATVNFAALSNYPTAQGSLNTTLAALGDATGGTYKAVVPASGNLTVTVSSDQLTITSDTNWLLNPSVDDIAIIPHASAIAGASQENAGAYVVLSATDASVVMQKIRSYNTSGTADIAHVQPAAVASTAITGAQNSAYATGEVLFFDTATITNTDAPVTGAGASMEISEGAGALSLAGAFVKWTSRSDILSESAANVGTISATAATSTLAVSLGNGAFWSTTPKVGDAVFIDYVSPLAGSGAPGNVGFYVVTAASANSLSLSKTDGISTTAVASVAIAGNQSTIQTFPSFVSTSQKALITNSSVETQDQIIASNISTNVQFPTDQIGGTVVMKLGYYNSAATAAVASIGTDRKLTITITASPAIDPIVVNTLKYPTLKALINFLNAQSGVTAEIANPLYNSAAPSILDMIQSMPILANHALSSLPGRIKNDYKAWSDFFANNLSILDFSAGSLLYKAGLPGADASAAFLTGGAKGGTTNAAVQAGFDAGLKVSTVQVIPLFSRDAYLDVNDGLTDVESTYSIDSINAALKSHVSTAWSTKMRKERFGLASFYGSFEDSKLAAQALDYEYVSMAFQLVRAVGANGEAGWNLPWLMQCMFAAGRSQAVLGTSLLRKSFSLLDVKHTGQEASIFTDTLLRDFEDDNQGEVEQAIEAGLLVVGNVEGGGLRLISPDLSTRSRINDGKSWLYERNSVSFVFIEVLQTLRSTLENFIGSRTSDVTPADIANVVTNVLIGFVGQGALIAYDPQILVTNLGNGYQVKARAKPTEALEFIDLEVAATRTI